MADIKALAESIVGLTLLEAQELKTLLKDEYGIEPAAGGAVMVAGFDSRTHEKVSKSSAELQLVNLIFHIFKWRK